MFKVNLPCGFFAMGQKTQSISTAVGAFIWLFVYDSYLIWAGCLIDSACVFIVLLSLGLVSHTVGLINGCHVVHQGDGLHSLMNSTADGLSDFSGCWSSGGWKVMGGLNTITEGTVIKIRVQKVF